MALGVPGRLRPRIFSTFGTTRVVGRHPNTPAAFTPGEMPGTHFQRLSRRQGTWFCRKESRKKSQVAPPGIDPGTVRLVAQRLNRYPRPPFVLLVMLVCSLRVINLISFRYIVILIVIRRVTLKLLELLPCRDTRVSLIHLRCP